MPELGRRIGYRVHRPLHRRLGNVQIVDERKHFRLVARAALEEDFDFRIEARVTGLGDVIRRRPDDCTNWTKRKTTTTTKTKMENEQMD